LIFRFFAISNEIDVHCLNFEDVRRLRIKRRQTLTLYTISWYRFIPIFLTICSIKTNDVCHGSGVVTLMYNKLQGVISAPVPGVSLLHSPYTQHGNAFLGGTN